ncbi:hypothetical protein [Pseudomonas putida]|uniref:hypothetical protein n=1 Tax=Pseudomonas putida TaxID=303 RepID=UPI0020231584|nr:hypothetical protein [Pseudomonas putida]MCL8307664.1 hypothetical protein [Pseudomonas putida]
MDIRFFFEQRLGFIRQLYLNGSASFDERKRKIENEEAPFIPPYSEDGEPPFQVEWEEADASIQVLGSSCLSMISASLHIYLVEWQDRLGPAPDCTKAAFKSGWPAGYKAYYESHGSDKFETGPFDYSLVSEIVLARNSIQHDDSLIFDTFRYRDSDLSKLPNPFFVSDRDKELAKQMDDGERSWLCRPHIHITTEKFLHTISEISALVEWLEKQGKEIQYRQFLERKKRRESSQN